jgi:poly(A) polymerase
LAHVFFGNEIIEVATFRAAAAPEREDAEDSDAEGRSEAGAERSNGDPGAEEPAAEFTPSSDFTPPSDSEHRAFDPRGRILRDNIYGTIEEDVWRRDFSANGLYYNIEDFSIWDFVDGVSDVKARRLKLIGDPETRYREDPVRMLRAVRFAAKLDFSIEPHTEHPIKQLAYLLDGVPPARLFDEVLKLFLSGFGARSYRLLQQYHLFEHLFPQSAAAFALPPYAYAAEMLEMGLANTDARIAADKPVTPTFLFAVLLWSAVLRELNERQAGPQPDMALLMQVCDTVLKRQQSRVSIPKRFSIPMRELLMLQPRFNRRSGVKSLSLMQHPRFRAAYDFLLLRAEAGVADPELAKWWTDIQLLPQEERVALVQARPAEPADDGAGGKPGRRRRRRRRGGASRS